MSSKRNSHVPTKQRCKYITSMDIQKRATKSESLIENHMRQECSESARERRTALYKSDQEQQEVMKCVCVHSLIHGQLCFFKRLDNRIDNNNNGCIFNATNPSMIISTRVRLKTLYLKHQNNIHTPYFNNALHSSYCRTKKQKQKQNKQKTPTFRNEHKNRELILERFRWSLSFHWAKNCRNFVPLELAKDCRDFVPLELAKNCRDFVLLELAM